MSQPSARPGAGNPIGHPDDTRETNIRAYVELLRSDLRSQKIAIITELMGFTEAEDAKFWPVYREYETAVAKVNDDRLALIKEYAANYEKLTDEVMQADLDPRANAWKTLLRSVQISVVGEGGRSLSSSREPASLFSP